MANAAVELIGAMFRAANAGGNWVDAEVQVCTDGPNTLITSRKPDDLPAFCATLVDRFGAARHSSAA